MANRILLKPPGYRVRVLKTQWSLCSNKALFAFPFRLPDFRLRHCSYSTLVFYTPEKPRCQMAFRVSTNSYVAIAVTTTKACPYEFS